MEEVNLAESTFIAKKLTQRMPGGFFVYHATGDEKFIYVNDFLLEIFGCETLEEFKELTGYTFRGMVHPDDLDRVEDSIARQIANDIRNIDYVEYRIIRKDGTIRWLDDYGRFVSTKTYGDVFYVFVHDITAQHEFREENSRREKVIDGLSIGFSSIYLLNLDKGTMRPYKLQNDDFNKILEDLNLTAQNAKWEIILPEYAKRCVV